jgi:hypothetical protein
MLDGVKVNKFWCIKQRDSPSSGVKRGRDEGSASRYTALESGAVQAVMLVPPFTILALKRGFNQLIGFNDVMNIQLGGLVVHTQKMKEKPHET